MAGHNKWSQIKRKKGALDAKRGQLFSKLAKEITVAVKMGGGDPNMNPRLRSAVATAKSESMPNDNIDRAIKRGTGEIEGAAAIEELTYEVYGPGGVAMIVETATDNKNRTAAEIRTILTKNLGNLGTPGSVAYLFTKKALFTVNSENEEMVMEAVLEAGAEDVQRGAEGVEVTGPVEAFDAIEKALAAADLEVARASLGFIPGTLAPIEDVDTATKVLRLLDKLEDHDDVQNVTTNADIPDAVMEQFSSEA